MKQLMRVKVCKEIAPGQLLWQILLWMHSYLRLYFLFFVVYNISNLPQSYRQSLIYNS